MLQARLRQLSVEHRRRDEELERRAASRFGALENEREEWEKRHSRGGSGAMDVERDAGTEKRASTANMPLLMQDGTSLPGTPSQTERALSTDLYFRPGTPGGLGGTLDMDKPQSPGLLPPIDLGVQVKSQLPEGLISKNAMIDDHPEIRKRKELIDEIRDLRRSIGSLGKAAESTRVSLGGVEYEADRQAALARATALARVTSPHLSTGTSAGILLGGGGGSSGNRDRARSMPLSMSSGGALRAPTATATGTTSPLTSSGRPGSAPLRRNEEWESYVSERKLFTPPSGVTPPIRPSPVPEPLLREMSQARVVPSEAVSSALEERKRRESLFGMGLSEKDTASGIMGGGSPSQEKSSWFNSDSSKRENSIPAPPRASPSHRRSNSLGDVFTRLTLPSSSSKPVTADPTTAPPDDKPSQSPQSPTFPRPVVLPPQRRTSLSSPPEPRVITYEELQERHKAKMKRIQEPVSRAAEEEATLAEARSRWERSKAIEKEVMGRKRAEAESKLRTRGGREKDHEPKDGQRRDSLSLERLKNSGGLGRMSSSSKVEEWRKYQAETTAAAAGGAAPAAAGTTGGEGTGRHRRSISTGGLVATVAAEAAPAGDVGPSSPKG